MAFCQSGVIAVSLNDDGGGDGGEGRGVGVVPSVGC